MEYSVFIAVFIAALVAMQIYLKRSFQGYLKRNTDTVSNTGQFSHALSKYVEVTRSSSLYKDTTTPYGARRIDFLEPDITINEPYVDNFSDKKLTEEELF